MNIVIVSGSVAGNKTRTVAAAALEWMQEEYRDHQYSFLDLTKYQLPYSDGRHYQDYPGETPAVLQTIMEADLLFVASPIFQAGMPGVLKNLFDLLPPDALEHIVTGLIVTAGSLRHFMIPSTQMKPVLTYLKAHIIEQYVFVEDRDFQGSTIANEDVYFRIHRLVREALLTAEIQSAVRTREEEAFGF